MTVAPYTVERWNRLSISLTGFAWMLAGALVFVPVVLSANTTQKMTSLLILILLAAMWNALAGYGGLVSVGQQAFIGLGAYGTVWLVNHNMKPYHAMVVAALFCGAIAAPLSFVVLRFRGAAFAIGMWVVAEVAGIFVSLDQSLGAGTGTSLIELNYYSPDKRQEVISKIGQEAPEAIDRQRKKNHAGVPGEAAEGPAQGVSRPAVGVPSRPPGSQPGAEAKAEGVIR